MFLFIYWLIILRAVVNGKAYADFDGLMIYGAGATSATDLFKVWAVYYESIRSPFSKVRIEFDSRGSTFGKTKLMAGQISFAVSDELLGQFETNTTDIRQIPCFAWSLVLAYNVPGMSNLTLTREQIVGIYNGTITNWNDTSFYLYNNPSSLPNATILPLARLEPAGSTLVFTKALSSFDENWKNKFGRFSNRSGWPNNNMEFAQRTTGMADAITNNIFSIGYVSVSGANEVDLNYAHIINKAGQRASFSVESLIQVIQIRMKDLQKNLRETIVDSELPYAYPMSTISFIFVNISIKTNYCASQVELYRFLHWTMNAEVAKKTAGSLGIVPVGSLMLPEIYSKVMLRMTCNGMSLDKLMREQVYLEEESLKTWKIPVMISVPIAFVIFICIVIYASYQKYLYLKMINKKAWRINFFDIEMKHKKDSHKNPNAKNIFIYDSNPTFCYNEQTGIYKGVLVSLRHFLLNEKPLNKWTNKSLKFLLTLKAISHSNLASFIGLTTSPMAELIFIEEHCSRGTIIKILMNPTLKMPQSICFAICRDICCAMSFLHEKQIIVGLLQLCSCLVDSRWMVKICGWEVYSICESVYSSQWTIFGKLTSKVNSTHSILSEIKYALNRNELDDSDRNLYFNFWLAPEIISSNYHYQPTKATDIYSFGLIMSIIFCKFYQKYVTNKFPGQIDQTILKKLTSLDPTISHDKIPEKICNLINISCHHDPIQRPKFDNLISMLRSYDNNPKFNVLDHIMYHYEHATQDIFEESYAASIDQVVELNAITLNKTNVV